MYQLLCDDANWWLASKRAIQVRRSFGKLAIRFSLPNEVVTRLESGSTYSATRRLDRCAQSSAVSRAGIPRLLHYLVSGDKAQLNVSAPGLVTTTNQPTTQLKSHQPSWDRRSCAASAPDLGFGTGNFSTVRLFPGRRWRFFSPLVWINSVDEELEQRWKPRRLWYEGFNPSTPSLLRHFPLELSLAELHEPKWLACL